MIVEVLQRTCHLESAVIENVQEEAFLLLTGLDIARISKANDKRIFFCTFNSLDQFFWQFHKNGAVIFKYTKLIG